ncbi:hypothetical protein Tco_1311965 [Tanacetum coccineum]
MNQEQDCKTEMLQLPTIPCLLWKALISYKDAMDKKLSVKVSKEKKTQSVAFRVSSPLENDAPKFKETTESDASASIQYPALTSIRMADHLTTRDDVVNYHYGICFQTTTRSLPKSMHKLNLNPSLHKEDILVYPDEEKANVCKWKQMWSVNILTEMIMPGEIK